MTLKKVSGVSVSSNTNECIENIVKQIYVDFIFLKPVLKKKCFWFLPKLQEEI